MLDSAKSLSQTFCSLMDEITGVMVGFSIKGSDND